MLVEQQLEILKGAIASVSYLSEETGFAVIRLQTSSFEVVTAAGTMPDAREGAEVELAGYWTTHPKFGTQFKFTSYSCPQPTSTEGIIAFLQVLKGIGPKTAKLLTEEYGERIFQILEEDPEELLNFRGITESNLPNIVESFHASQGMSDLIAFLHELKVSAGYAAKLFKKYGKAAIRTIQENPYILADEVQGFGFKRSDEVARGLNIGLNSSVRIQAAILYVMKGVANMHGHCYLPRNELICMTCEAIALPGFKPVPETVAQEIEELKDSKTGLSRRLVEENGNIFLNSFYRAEQELTERIKSLSGRMQSNIDINEWLWDYELNNEIELAPQQRAAVATAASNGVTIISGGPGTGKSTISKAVIEFWHKQRRRVIAIAPTGRAAQRIREATGLRDASTIHRLLGWNGSGGFAHNRENPVSGDAFLIDESSMMDLKLANSLFQAIPDHAVVAFVGDVDQLPSIGAGNVLKDLIISGELPVVRLTEIFRQVATSRIIQASSAINEGRLPELEIITKDTAIPRTDALWIKCAQGQIISAIKWLIADKLPQLGWKQDDIQCLSAMNKGDVGNVELNKMIQLTWNPVDDAKEEVGGFREGDRVIQTQNNYNKLVYNGDIGKIIRIDKQEKEVIIWFPDLDNPEGRFLAYNFSELGDLMLAFSISIHRSQGAEFPVVVMPVSMSQYMMLQRNLIYTGATRAKKLLVVVGEERPLQIAVKSQKLQERNTKLAWRLQEAGNF
jgi:exodeoxyribonuclease V alpha subunit